MTSGIYVIKCPNGSVYVGESKGIDSRGTVRCARIFGLTVELVEAMPGSTKKERLRSESAVVKEYRNKGIVVVSLTAEEVAQRACNNSGQTHEQLSEAGRKGAEGLKKIATNEDRIKWGKLGGSTTGSILTDRQLRARRENGRRVGLTGSGRRAQLQGRVSCA